MYIWEIITERTNEDKTITQEQLYVDADGDDIDGVCKYALGINYGFEETDTIISIRRILPVAGHVSPKVRPEQAE